MRKSVFQQKWAAKKDLRAYHAPDVSEKQLLNRHWRNQLPMRYMTQKEQERYVGLCSTDGKGFHLSFFFLLSSLNLLLLPPTPRIYAINKMYNVFIVHFRCPPVQALSFAELERRLDVALFRAHFCDSLPNAKKVVLMGRVKVNGVKVILHHC